MEFILYIIPLLAGYLLDRILGDPSWIPHPVVGFGKLIAKGEKTLNKGNHRLLKGAVLSIGLIAAVYIVSWYFLDILKQVAGETVFLLVSTILVFLCLAGTTLIREVKAVFEAADRSLEEGRRQVSRIVGRDTQELSDHEVRTAALETLAENLSDGVIAPLFWFLLLGVPGMLAYKMVNTLDSMIGYRNERYALFGRWAARIDDVANYIPARLTALLMVIAGGKPSLIKFVAKFGNQHASPNSGYPESALAGILNCRFGGPHNYFGENIWKPYIGTNERPLTSKDVYTAIRINRTSEMLMLLITVVILYLLSFI